MGILVLFFLTKLDMHMPFTSPASIASFLLMLFDVTAMQYSVMFCHSTVEGLHYLFVACLFYHVASQQLQIIAAVSDAIYTNVTHVMICAECAQYCKSLSTLINTVISYLFCRLVALYSFDEIHYHIFSKSINGLIQRQFCSSTCRFHDYIETLLNSIMQIIRLNTMMANTVKGKHCDLTRRGFVTPCGDTDQHWLK